MKIYAPDKTYTGEDHYADLVLNFKEGVAEHDGDLPWPVRSYLASTGYGLDEDPAPRPGPEQRADHPDVSQVGTPLGDVNDPRSHAFRQPAADDGPFDPAGHTVEEVRAYLDALDDSDPDARDAEFARVVEAEKAGKNRSTLLASIEGTPAS